MPPLRVFRCGIMIEDQRSGLCSFYGQVQSMVTTQHHVVLNKSPSFFFLFFLYFDKSFTMYTRVATDSRSPASLS